MQSRRFYRQVRGDENTRVQTNFKFVAGTTSVRILLRNLTK
jgi:hypothetical protein